MTVPQCEMPSGCWTLRASSQKQQQCVPLGVLCVPKPPCVSRLPGPAARPHFWKLRRFPKGSEAGGRVHTVPGPFPACHGRDTAVSSSGSKDPSPAIWAPVGCRSCQAISISTFDAAVPAGKAQLASGGGGPERPDSRMMQQGRAETVGAFPRPSVGQSPAAPAQSLPQLWLPSSPHPFVYWSIFKIYPKLQRSGESTDFIAQAAGLPRGLLHLPARETKVSGFTCFLTPQEG